MRQPNIDWNFSDCKKYALDLIDELISNRTKEAPHFPRIFKDFIQYNSLNAGVNLGVVLGHYSTICKEASIPQSVWAMALREAVEDNKDNIYRWYHSQLY